MSSKTVKGFTLIELIVVMAIFGLILATAMLLYRPSAKMMVESSVQENSQAVMTNVGNYLENEFASAERLDAYDVVNGTDVERNGRVRDFALKYYEGILRNGSGGEPATAKYGSGRIHVMEIINTPTSVDDPANPGTSINVIDSHIRTYVYDCNFATGAVTVTENTGLRNLNALNQAYYQDSYLTIRLGEFDETNWNDTTPATAALHRDAVQPNGLTFSIRAMSRRQFNGNVYNNYRNVTIPLVNLLHMDIGGSYYGLVEDTNTDPATHVKTTTYSIGLLKDTKSLDNDSDLLNSREQSANANYRVTKLTGSATDPITSYMFIYSYGAEIDTTAAP